MGSGRGVTHARLGGVMKKCEPGPFGPFSRKFNLVRRQCSLEKEMKPKLLVLVSCTVVVLAGCAASQTKDGGWTCSAPNMISGSYDGGTHAYIHESGYPHGNNYLVKYMDSNKVVGKTRYDTSFTCTRN